MEAFGILAWYCCLEDNERLGLDFTFDNTMPLLPHISETAWEAIMAAFDMPSGSVRLQAFIDVYGVYTSDVEVMGVMVTVINLTDEFWFALDSFYAAEGRDCPTPCKIRHFTDI